jgi:hypothetical protein
VISTAQKKRFSVFSEIGFEFALLLFVDEIQFNCIKTD